MSLESWKAEFYPVEAKNVPEDQAVAHSLRKWRGLTLKNLERHGVERINQNQIGGVDDNEETNLFIDGSSCALCKHYYESEHGDYCDNCPLATHLGHSCAASYSEVHAPYDDWYAEGNPLPMTQALEAVAAKTPAIQEAV